MLNAYWSHILVYLLVKGRGKGKGKGKGKDKWDRVRTSSTSQLYLNGYDTNSGTVRAVCLVKSVSYSNQLSRDF
jgi:hypothetical protein